jgi:hypothetical protein
MDAQNGEGESPGGRKGGAPHPAPSGVGGSLPSEAFSCLAMPIGEGERLGVEEGWRSALPLCHRPPLRGTRCRRS